MLIRLFSIIGLSTLLFTHPSVAQEVPRTVDNPITFESLAKQEPELPGWLGIKFGPVKEVVTKMGTYDGRKGALITAVAPNGPAEVAGLQPNDIVLKVGDIEIHKPQYLANAVRDTPSGAMKDFLIWRDGSIETIQVLIGGKAWAAAFKTGDLEMAQGYAYYNGNRVFKNRKTAAEWFRKAADLGHVRGQGMLGNMHLYGIGIVKDYSKAKHWLEKAAAQGDIDAIKDIGEMHAKGYGVVQSDETALLWYLKAAEFGDPASMAKVGEKYLNQSDTLENRVEAYVWLSLAKRYGWAKIQNSARMQRLRTGYKSWPDEKLQALNDRVATWKPKSVQ